MKTPLKPGRYMLHNDARVTLVEHPAKPDVLLASSGGAYSGTLEIDPITGRCLKAPKRRRHPNTADLGFSVARTIEQQSKTFAPRDRHEDD